MSRGPHTLRGAAIPSSLARGRILLVLPGKEPCLKEGALLLLSVCYCDAAPGCRAAGDVSARLAGLAGSQGAVVGV